MKQKGTFDIDLDISNFTVNIIKLLMNKWLTWVVRSQWKTPSNSFISRVIFYGNGKSALVSRIFTERTKKEKWMCYFRHNHFNKKWCTGKLVLEILPCKLNEPILSHIFIWRKIWIIQVTLKINQVQTSKFIWAEQISTTHFVWFLHLVLQCK